MDKITAFLRLFSPDAKCQACPFLSTPEHPVFKLIYADGTSKKLHADCQKREN